MTRHTRSKQLIKLAMMQGEDVKFAKWNYSPGHNLTIEGSIAESNKWEKVIDPNFVWYRMHKLKFTPTYRNDIRKPEFRNGVTIQVKTSARNSIRFSEGDGFKYMDINGRIYG